MSRHTGVSRRRDGRYTTCFGTDKPHCVLFDGGKEKETNFGVKYYNIECRYLDYDGPRFWGSFGRSGYFQIPGEKAC